jgi:hypothetical protein
MEPNRTPPNAQLPQPRTADKRFAGHVSVMALEIRLCSGVKGNKRAAMEVAGVGRAQGLV